MTHRWGKPPNEETYGRRKSMIILPPSPKGEEHRQNDTGVAQR